MEKDKTKGKPVKMEDKKVEEPVVDKPARPVVTDHFNHESRFMQVSPTRQKMIDAAKKARLKKSV